MNLLISRHDKIGDFVVTLPLFKAIKTQYPQTKITALVSKINFDFAKNIDFIDDVILFDKNDLKTTLNIIKQKRFDASISAYIDTKLGKLLFKSKIKKRVAPATKIAQLFFNKKVKQRRSQVLKTEWQYNLDLAIKLFKDINLEFSKPVLNIDGSEQIKKFRNEFNIDESKKIVAFHPGFGGSSEGNLTIDDYIKLAKIASLKDNIQVVFTFGPDDLKVKDEIMSKVDFDVVFYESVGSIINFCKLLSQFELFISTSTGPMHLAGCVNTKTISFFGDNLFASSKRWATVSETKNQNNFMLSLNYTKEKYLEIENRLKEIIND
ncbi:heptosyltransferase [Malaciobacter molluscorum LMG 25693]|uniref:Heptosyltransferase n=1 Tax=Malaciobacter molluscorum LMG 25693 TaxID=870501 RepID=A0A2G1DJR6_9BACT|nr:glycosyltransferase family 9 protein [Malaciobacter molluscorum]AXX92898.1 heptosyltransferase [Malaciobacter molluscorum LMG 25693]PHO18731.1 heptosyltransferase [Malaciobacter molluscorum LMG 25693]